MDSVSTEGNKITRKSLILRELEYGIGDTIREEDLQGALDLNRLRVLNLGIFSKASVTVGRITPDGRIALHVKVNESWYWFPAPVFELVDRNFNVWWKEFNRSLSRTNYGLDYTQVNFTGHADQINLTATAGYNQRFNLRYRTPWLNKKGTLGLQIGGSYSRIREVAVRTIGNKLDFKSDPSQHLIRRFIADATLSWRPGLLHTHALLYEYRDTKVADIVAAEINPDFFLNGRKQQRHSSLVYQYNFDDRNVRQYPTKGWFIYTEVRQNGLLPGDDVFLGRLRLEATRYMEINPYFSVEVGARVRTTWPRSKPPYFNNTALGYGGDLVRGYEYYVMDGLDLGVLKTSVRTKILHRMIPYPRFLSRRFPRFQPFEIRAYLSINNDIGYANDPYYAEGNPLVNRPLYGYGIGLDVVLFYNRVFSIAWMRTDIGESGFFIRTRI